MDQTSKLLRDRFREYYSRVRPRTPPQIERREWGFIPFDGSMRRHKSFRSENELLAYLRKEVPRHAYFSCAYYEKPEMMEGWLGADLIFDLDADHLPYKGTFEQMLEKVKEETVRLIDFLVEDFALKDLEIVFSGGRGYHVHVRDECVKKLTSKGRREVLDYVTGCGIDFSKFLIEESVGRAKTYRLINMGWGRRILNYLVTLLEEVGKMSDEEAAEHLKGLVGRKKLAETLIKVARNEDAMQRMRMGEVSQFREFGQIKDELVKQISVRILSRPDEKVTHDIHRLIRLPDSLHGGTSLRVTPLRIEELEDFDPLSDAVVFENDPMEVNVMESGSIRMNGELFEFRKGKNRLPEFVAMFLMCKGIANLDEAGGAVEG